MTKIFTLGLIGNGYWINNYKKTISEINVFCYVDLMVLFGIKDVASALLLTDSDWKDIINKSKIDAIVIASSPELQTKIAPLFIKLKLPMILEKPFGLSFQGLVNIWNIKNKVKSSIIDGNFGPFRRYTPPLFDWAPHSVGVVLSLMGMGFTDFKAEIIYNDNQDTKRKEIWRLKFEYPDGKKALIILGNGFSKKIRRVRIDILGKSNPLIFENNLIQSNEYINFLKIKKIDINQSPMHVLLKDFYNSLLTGNKDKSESAELAYETIRLLDTLS